MAAAARHDDDQIRPLPIRVRHTECGDGVSIDDRTVYCPLTAHSMSESRCLSCPRFEAVTPAGTEGGRLWCHLPSSVPSPISRDLVQQLKHVQVREIMTRDVTCVDSEVDLAELARVYEHFHLHVVPVVEDEGVLIGIVSKSDLHRAAPDRASLLGGVPSNQIVEEVMTAAVVKIEETATLEQAAALFALKGVHRVPVVGETGKVVGMLSLSDLVRWLSGEALPSP